MRALRKTQKICTASQGKKKTSTPSSDFDTCNFLARICFSLVRWLPAPGQHPQQYWDTQLHL